MILQSLNQLYDRLAGDSSYRLPTPGYSKQDITFEIVLRPDGTPFDLHDARVEEITTDKKGKVKRKVNPASISVPGEARASEASMVPGFLWDDTRFVLGWHSDSKKDPERIQQCFSAFVERHVKLLPEIPSEAFKIVCSFLQRWTPSQVNDYPQLLEIGKGRCVFRVLGDLGYVHDDPLVRQWWSAHQLIDSDEKGYCLVTGLNVKQDVARLHLGIFGLYGTPYTGAALSSFNCDSFTSYGKEKNNNSPVSTSAVFRYGNALNALLDGPQSHRHKIRVGEVTMVFWTERKTVLESLFAEFVGGDIESDVQSETIKGDESLHRNIETFLKILRQGGGTQVAELDVDPDSKFYVLGLTLAKGRLAVRLWHISSISQMVNSLKSHYDALQIVQTYDNDPSFPPVWRLLDEILPIKDGKPDRDQLPPNFTGQVLMSVLTGIDYPLILLHAVIRRIQVTERISESRIRNRVNYIRAAILKAILTRNFKKKMSEALDPDRPEPAYHLGRLFAVYETAQRHAHEWKLERTIRETLYSAASATPLSVLGRLERLFHHHTREKRFPPGSSKPYAVIASEINQKFCGYPIYPAALNLIDQALFSVGYYHQMHLFSSLAKAARANVDQSDQIATDASDH